MDLNKFKEVFNDCELVDDKIVIKTRLHEVIEFVKNNYSYNVLKEIIAVHKQNNQIELIYHLYTTVDEEDLLISINSEGDAESIIDIFESARADENEIFDMFGVKFLGNDDLKRLYMPEDWEGHPLRKDYVQDDTRLA